MSCQRRFWVICICLFCFCRPTASVYAGRTLSIAASTPTLFGDECVTLVASASGFIDGETIYIKGAFFQSGSSNYFGYSKKADGTWIKNGESASTQPMVHMGEWDNQLMVKSDFLDSGYHGEGEYLLKLGYYYVTSDANVSSVNWSTNSIPITISEPDPTVTPTSTPSPTSSPTHTIAPSPTVYRLPTITPTVVATIHIVPMHPVQSAASDILGIQNDVTESASIHDDTAVGIDPPQRVQPSRMVFALLFIGVGIALLSCALAIEKADIWNKKQKLRNPS